MKKTAAMLFVLAVMLIASLGGTAFAVVDTDSWNAPESGFEMRIPDACRDAKGYIVFSDLGEGMEPGSGLVSAVATYVPMPAEEYEALVAEEMEAYENDDMEKLYEVLEKLEPAEWTLFYVYGINRDRGEEELRSIVTEKYLDPSYFDGDEEMMAAVEALYVNMEYREIGEKDGIRYYLSTFDPDAYFSLRDFEGSTQIDPVYLDEFKALSEQISRMTDNVTLTGGANLADAAEAGTKLVFETTDLEGNPVSSEDIFSGHTITMINMWATWCGHCVEELPELSEMAKDFEAQGSQIIGLCLDAEDEETMAEGRAILENAGVEYLNIVPFEGREELLPNKVYPTTYFVDENGIVLDEIITGAVLSKYPLALEKLLSR